MRVPRKFQASIVAVIGLATSTAQSESINQSQTETVVLLHGLCRTSLSMKRLEWHLAGQGYRVINRTYLSTRQSIESLANDWLDALLSGEISTSDTKVHFVTHSLGGIVLRQYLSNHELPCPGRVVMLGPPNQGSELADLASQYALLRWLIGPNLAQLGTTEFCLPQLLEAVTLPLGIIAVDRSSNPIFSSIIPGPDDGKVSVARTRAEGMTGFLVQHQSHTWLMWRRSTLEQVGHFLIHGHFSATAHDAGQN